MVKYVVMRRQFGYKNWSIFNSALQTEKKAQAESQYYNKVSRNFTFRIERADRVTPDEMRGIGTKKDIIRFLKAVAKSSKTKTPKSVRYV